jgi:oxygen-independent coproporphyrinogen-3 oxidase
MNVLQPTHIPLALYLHVPWCVKKCPYCDFNSHAAGPDGLSDADQAGYLAALWQDVQAQQASAQGRPLHSVFIGGGTPSLVGARHYADFFKKLQHRFALATDCEITLEANPGTLEHAPFAAYRDAGVNRLSLGVQSLNDDQLQRLGRVHGAAEALQALRQARAAGFDRVNVDLMHGLPSQTVAQALFDLQQAVENGATHLSWYQLTIEPNTVFFRTQPVLPDDERLADIQAAGEQYLRAQGFVQYEVSAWTREQPSAHNLNYWQFGDYLAAGAGAHGKISWPDRIERFQKTRLPRDYLRQQPAPAQQVQVLEAGELPFEFLMNALRLHDGVPAALYPVRTGQSLSVLQQQLQPLRAQGLLVADPDRLAATPLGWRYLNQLLTALLPPD